MHRDWYAAFGSDSAFANWLPTAPINDLSLAFMELDGMSKRMGCCGRRDVILAVIRERLEVAA